MPTYTTNLALIKPAEGEQALISQINSNMDALDNVIGVIQNKMYPVGSIYMSVSATNPGGLLGGTWVAWGSGRVPVGVATGETEFNTVEKTGGAKTLPAHTHTINHDHPSATTSSSGSHTHQYKGTTGTNVNAIIDNAGTSTGASTATGNANAYHYVRTQAMPSAGAHTHTVDLPNFSGNSGSTGSGSHGVLQPYITCYMWKRTA